MLTRHLYEADEVSAALSWSIRCCRVKEAAFWTKEFLDSEMTDDLYKTLLDAWLWNFGAGKIEALRILYTLFHREEETTESDILAYVCTLTRLSKTHRDSSVFALLSLGLLDTKTHDRVSQCPDLDGTISRLQTNPQESAFLRACYQGKTLLAWQLSRPLWQHDVSRTWSLLRAVQYRKHGSSPFHHALEILEEYDELWDSASRAAAVASVCLDSKRLLSSIYAMEVSLPFDVLEDLSQWEERVGRRNRRLYAIPKDSLYYITSRGRISTSKSTRKRGYVVCEKALQGCPFWDRVLEEEKPENSDTAKEHFWDTYFPDDIPDEWSLEDQQKSHGTGVLCLTEKPNYFKYANKWFRGSESSSVWMGLNDGLQALMKIGAGSMETLSWKALYEARDFTLEMADWWLEPVKQRQLVVAGSEGNMYPVSYKEST